MDHLKAIYQLRVSYLRIEVRNSLKSCCSVNNTELSFQMQEFTHDPFTRSKMGMPLSCLRRTYTGIYYLQSSYCINALYCLDSLQCIVDPLVAYRYMVTRCQLGMILLLDY